jgi:hypothetical protein
VSCSCPVGIVNGLYNSGRRVTIQRLPVLTSSSEASRSATTISSPAFQVSARMRPYGSGIIGLSKRKRAGADLVVVYPDPVAVDQEQPVVVRARRQPAHEPTSALGATQLGLDGSGVGVAVLPQRLVDQAHGMRVGRVAAAGLVGGEEDLGAL